MRKYFGGNLHLNRKFVQRKLSALCCSVWPKCEKKKWMARIEKGWSGWNFEKATNIEVIEKKKVGRLTKKKKKQT